MLGFVAFYNGKQVDVYAEDLYDAKQKAVGEMKEPKKKVHMVSVMLAADENGEEVVHTFS